MTHPNDVLSFWRSAGPQRWWSKDAGFDDAVRLKFEPVHHACARGEHAGWAETAEGALALVICLDQFPRNLYRDSAHSYATDGLARSVARRALEQGFDRELNAALRPFLYMPLQHSEDLDDQRLSLELFSALAADGGDTDTPKFARIHLEIIERFGRFPHRNPALGRATTPEEQAFLDEGGFAG